MGRSVPGLLSTEGCYYYDYLLHEQVTNSHGRVLVGGGEYTELSLRLTMHRPPGAEPDASTGDEQIDLARFATELARDLARGGNVPRHLEILADLAPEMLTLKVRADAPDLAVLALESVVRRHAREWPRWREFDQRIEAEVVPRPEAQVAPVPEPPAPAAAIAEPVAVAEPEAAGTRVSPRLVQIGIAVVLLAALGIGLLVAREPQPAELLVDPPATVEESDPAVAGATTVNIPPTAAPVAAPTLAATPAPTAEPPVAPAAAPTAEPTAVPTLAPTAVPTLAPTAVPTVAPTAVPTPAPTAAPALAPTAVPTLAPTAAPTLAPTQPPAPIVTDFVFTGGTLAGWPNNTTSIAWATPDGYRIFARQPTQFVAIGNLTDPPLADVVVSARFRKVGGPPGGGFGIIVRDQGPGPRDGINQVGRFYVLEVGDRGEVGIWRRADSEWVDLVPWTRSSTVRPGMAENDVVVRAISSRLTLLVNGTQVASAEDASLAQGAVGVFVGGDQNDVLLREFRVERAS